MPTIRFVLFEARPAGLDFHQLVRATDLSRHQVRDGLAALRDLAAERGWPPLIWTCGGAAWTAGGPAVQAAAKGTESMRRRRYPSDMTDAEWALIEPLLPPPACESRRGGRPEEHPRREIVDAIRYVVDTGCKWRALPADFPPWRTVWGFMARWAASGVIGQIRDALAGRVRREMGKGPRAVATIIDSQSVKAASTVGKDSRGYDPGKKINGRKRHLVVDTRGLPLMAMVTPADLHDSAAKEVLFRLRLMHPGSGRE